MKMTFRRAICPFLAVATLQLMGCASIVSGTNQSVSVETKTESGQAVAGASCKLTNNKGAWFVTTPGSTTVHRSYEALSVRCEKESHEVGLVSASSSTKPMAFGNIIFGGVIGVGVDITTGAAYDYPNLISVTMGKTPSATPAQPGAAELKSPPAQAPAQAQAQAQAEPRR